MSAVQWIKKETIEGATYANIKRKGGRMACKRMVCEREQKK